MISHYIFRTASRKYIHAQLASLDLLHIPSTSNTKRLPTNVAEQRRCDSQHRTRRLRRRPGPPQRNILERRRASLPRRLLRTRDPERDFVSIWRRDERTLLFRRRQAGQDMPERNCVRAHAEGWAPFFRDRFGEACDAGFGQGVVGLAGVAVEAGGGGDVDDVSGLAVFDAEVGGGVADELEGCGAVEGDDCFPLLVCGLCRTWCVSCLLLARRGGGSVSVCSPCESRRPRCTQRCSR